MLVVRARTSTEQPGGREESGKEEAAEEEEGVGAEGGELSEEEKNEEKMLFRLDMVLLLAANRRSVPKKAVR
jgi:hypothetical protein